jgi:glycosyltransferase involved in cell wall biosynthesis
MKILHINILYAPYDFGGTEVTLQTLVEGMAARGHDVLVLTTGPDAGMRNEIINGVKVLRVGVRNIYWQAMREKPASWKRALWHLTDLYNPYMRQIVLDVVTREKPDIVSVHNLPGFSAAAWGAIYQARVPMVQVLHDQYAICPRCTMFRNGDICKRQCLACRLLRLFHPRLSNKVTSVVGVSRFVLDHHLQYGYFKNTPVKRVIHNARDMSWALSVPCRQQDETVRFGFIGTLTQSKGIELLLKVFKRISKSNWQLHIAGTGPSLYENMLHDSYAGTNVIFHGVQKPVDFYPNIDVLVVPSIWNDTFPGVVFEGLAFGKPLIGARRGGIPEMIEDHVNGLLFDPQRPEELMAAMVKMSEDADFRASASRAAYNAAPYYLDSNRFLSSYENLYYDLCRQI